MRKNGSARLETKRRHACPNNGLMGSGNRRRSRSRGVKNSTRTKHNSRLYTQSRLFRSKLCPELHKFPARMVFSFGAFLIMIYYACHSGTSISKYTRGIYERTIFGEKLGARKGNSFESLRRVGCTPFVHRFRSMKNDLSGEERGEEELFGACGSSEKTSRKKWIYCFGTSFSGNSHRETFIP